MSASLAAFVASDVKAERALHVDNGQLGKAIKEIPCAGCLDWTTVARAGRHFDMSSTGQYAADDIGAIGDSVKARAAAMVAEIKQDLSAISELGMASSLGDRLATLVADLRQLTEDCGVKQPLIAVWAGLEDSTRDELAQQPAAALLPFLGDIDITAIGGQLAFLPSVLEHVDVLEAAAAEWTALKTQNSCQRGHELPSTIENRRQDVLAALGEIEAAHVQELQAMHTQAWQHAAQCCQALEDWLASKDHLALKCTTVLEDFVLEEAGHFESFPEQWTKFEGTLPSKQKRYEGNARAAKAKLEVCLSQEERAALVLPFFKGFRQSIIELAERWRRLFIDEQAPDILNGLAVVRVTVQKRLQETVERLGTNPTATEALEKCLQARSYLDEIDKGLTDCVESLKRSHLERLEKINQELDRAEALLQEAGPTYTEKKAVATDKDFRRRLRKIENKLSDERESASAAVRDAMSSPKIITALLSVALAVCTEAADSEAAGVGAWRDRLCASLADIHTQATALWADFHRQRSQGFNALLLAGADIAFSRLQKLYQDHLQLEKLAELLPDAAAAISGGGGNKGKAGGKGGGKGAATAKSASASQNPPSSTDAADGASGAKKKKKKKKKSKQTEGDDDDGEVDMPSEAADAADQAHASDGNVSGPAAQSAQPAAASANAGAAAAPPAQPTEPAGGPSSDVESVFADMDRAQLLGVLANTMAENGRLNSELLQTRQLLLQATQAHDTANSRLQTVLHAAQQLQQQNQQLSAQLQQAQQQNQQLSAQVQMQMQMNQPVPALPVADMPLPPGMGLAQAPPALVSEPPPGLPSAFPPPPSRAAAPPESAAGMAEGTRPARGGGTSSSGDSQRGRAAGRVRGRARGGGGRGSRAADAEGATPRENLRCANCGAKGHHSFACRQPCRKCGDKGHISDRCPSQ